jgi:hypothetical protein
MLFNRGQVHLTGLTGPREGSKFDEGPLAGGLRDDASPLTIDRPRGNGSILSSVASKLIQRGQRSVNRDRR